MNILNKKNIIKAMLLVLFPMSVWCNPDELTKLLDQAIEEKNAIHMSFAFISNQKLLEVKLDREKMSLNTANKKLNDEFEEIIRFCQRLESRDDINKKLFDEKWSRFNIELLELKNRGEKLNQELQKINAQRSELLNETKKEMIDSKTLRELANKLNETADIRQRVMSEYYECIRQEAECSNRNDKEYMDYTLSNSIPADESEMIDRINRYCTSSDEYKIRRIRLIELFSFRDKIRTQDALLMAEKYKLDAEMMELCTFDNKLSKNKIKQEKYDKQYDESYKELSKLAANTAKLQDELTKCIAREEELQSEKQKAMCNSEMDNSEKLEDLEVRLKENADLKANLERDYNVSRKQFSVAIDRKCENYDKSRANRLEGIALNALKSQMQARREKINTERIEWNSKAKKLRELFINDCANLSI